MKVDASPFVTYRVANTAVRTSREWAAERGWSPRTVSSLKPFYETGRAGVASSLRYVFYQNQGTAPRLMTELEGKTIPIKDDNGKTRFVKVKGVGKPGWVTLPGGVKVWKAEKWKHPGIKHSKFMQSSLKGAIEEARPAMRREVESMLGMRGGAQ